MNELVITFEVEDIDQVGEGLEVWTVTEECIDSEGAAAELAREWSMQARYRTARIVRVTREVVSVYRVGEKQS